MGCVIDREIARLRAAREVNQQEKAAFDKEEALLRQVPVLRAERYARTASRAADPDAAPSVVPAGVRVATALG